MSLQLGIARESLKEKVDLFWPLEHSFKSGGWGLGPAERRDKKEEVWKMKEMKWNQGTESEIFWLKQSLTRTKSSENQNGRH